MRKILGILLALSLALFLPVPALAASGDVTYLAYNAETGEFDPQTKAAGEYTVVTGQTAWGAGWYVVSADVEISTRITVSGDVHLILVDGYTLNAKKGITVNSGNSLSIYGQTAGTGALTTGTPGQFYAGIGGGGSNQSSGVITINGGTVNATSGSYAAGIGGGGFNESGGTVIINGGTVKATSTNGAGIGGGYSGGGTVTINGGVVEATGGSQSAGIGGGYNGTVTVTINGGTVTSTGGDSGGAGIGSGNSGGGTVTINGGVVTAKGGIYGAGIGVGEEGKVGTVTISGGVVNATGGSSSAGIGSGGGSSSATVTISGGLVTVTISGGFVTATGGSEGYYGAGAAIGSGGAIGGNTGTEVAESSFTNAVVLRKNDAASTMTGKVYGSPTLTADATVPQNATLTVPADSTLTIGEGVTLTNNGTVTNSGTVINNGAIKSNPVTGGGAFIDGGNIVIDENSKNPTGAASLAHEVAPAYTVTIPASVTLGGTATVEAENVRVDYGKQVVVRLGSGSALTVALEGDASEKLDYTVSVSGQKVGAGGAVLAVNPDDATETALAGGSAQLAFALAENAVAKYAGNYTGTVTFTVSVETAGSTSGTD